MPCAAIYEAGEARSTTPKRNGRRECAGRPPVEAVNDGDGGGGGDDGGDGDGGDGGASRDDAPAPWSKHCPPRCRGRCRATTASPTPGPRARSRCRPAPSG